MHVGEGDEKKINEGKGDIVVTTLCDISKGEELLKCYGWRPAWDIASSYGFVPKLKKERWECSVIPLFPAVLDLVSGVISTPGQNASSETKLDLLLETNYGPLVKAVIAAVDAANEIEARRESAKDADDSQSTNVDRSDRPELLNQLEIVSLFRPPPAHTAKEFPFTRRQPCVVVGTKIQAYDSASNINRHHCKKAIQSILPAFRAAASALSQLRHNHQLTQSTHNSSGDNDPSPIKASQMAIAAASLDSNTNWDEHALTLILEGIQDRIQTLIEGGKAADTWISGIEKVVGANDYNDYQHRQLRAGMAKDAREAEITVLHTFKDELSQWII